MESTKYYAIQSTESNKFLVLPFHPLYPYVPTWSGFPYGVYPKPFSEDQLECIADNLVNESLRCVEVSFPAGIEDEAGKEFHHGTGHFEIVK